MRSFLFSLCLAGLTLSVSAQDAPSNHVDMTAQILDFLSRTELCLNTCRDESSTKAAVPQLQQLKQECDKIVEQQKALPEPTVQDYMAVQNQMETFNSIWKAIRDHIERMQMENLMSPEIAAILLISPDSAHTTHRD